MCVSSSTGRRVGRVGPGASRADHAPFASRAKGRRRFRRLREEGGGRPRRARRGRRQFRLSQRKAPGALYQRRDVRRRRFRVCVTMEGVSSADGSSEKSAKSAPHERRDDDPGRRREKKKKKKKGRPAAPRPLADSASVRANTFDQHVVCRRGRPRSRRRLTGITVSFVPRRRREWRRRGGAAGSPGVVAATALRRCVSQRVINTGRAGRARSARDNYGVDRHAHRGPRPGREGGVRER